MRRYGVVRSDRGAVSLWVGALVAVAIIVVALLLYLYIGTDNLGRRATSKDIAIVEVQGRYNIDRFGFPRIEQFLGLGLDDLLTISSAKMTVKVNYSMPTSWHISFPKFSAAGIFGDPTLKIECSVRCTGPHDFIDTCHQTKKVQMGVLYDSKHLTFDVFRFPVKDPGKYTLTMKITIDNGSSKQEMESLTQTVEVS